MLRSAFGDSDLCKFYTVCGFYWVFPEKEYHSDSRPIQLANLIDPKAACSGENAGDLRNCRGLFSANNYKLSLEPSWEDAS